MKSRTFVDSLFIFNTLYFITSLRIHTHTHTSTRVHTAGTVWRVLHCSVLMFAYVVIRHFTEVVTVLLQMKLNIILWMPKSANTGEQKKFMNGSTWWIQHSCSVIKSEFSLIQKIHIVITKWGAPEMFIFDFFAVFFFLFFYFSDNKLWKIGGLNGSFRHL